MNENITHEMTEIETADQMEDAVLVADEHEEEEETRFYEFFRH